MTIPMKQRHLPQNQFSCMNPQNEQLSIKANVPGKLVVPRINRNNEVENTGYMLNELMKAKVNRLRLSVRSYINPTEQNKPLELKPWASDVTRDPCKP